MASSNLCLNGPMDMTLIYFLLISNSVSNILGKIFVIIGNEIIGNLCNAIIKFDTPVCFKFKSSLNKKLSVILVNFKNLINKFKLSFKKLIVVKLSLTMDFSIKYLNETPIMILLIVDFVSLDPTSLSTIKSLQKNVIISV
ncbi:unnamed protein product [[Candida] boidinii]|nr:unnamed protein product [[Candida] boidinii]